MIQFEGHTDTVCSLAFSPESLLLASGAKDGSTRLWDAAGGMVREFVPYHRTAPTALAWIPSGDGLVAGEGVHIGVIRPTDERCFDRGASVGLEPITSLAFLNGTLLAVGCGKRNDTGPGGLDLWDVRAMKKRPVPTAIGRPHGVRAIAAHSPTKHLHWITGVSHSTACLWRSWCITSPNATDTKLNKPAADISVSPDGTTVAIASDWLVRVFTADGKPRTDLSGHKGQVSGVGFVNGGRTVVSASWDETVRFWDVATGKETARFPLAIGKLTALAVSPDGTRVAVGGTDGPIVVIDAE